jgi:hypothetical protein
MWKSILEPNMSQMTEWHMRIACWIPKATDRHTVINYNTYCFPQQQCLHERASILRYTYVRCLSCVMFMSLYNMLKA